MVKSSVASVTGASFSVSLVVGGGEPSGDLHGPLDGFSHGNRFARQPVAERRPFQHFRDDVRRLVVPADVVNGEDVGMIQRRGGARFLLEAGQAIGIG